MSASPKISAAAPPWRELWSDDEIEILRYAAEGLAEGSAVALTTLTEIRGGAARALGAQMAIKSNGAYCGYVSGGYLEAPIAAEALAALAEGRDREVRFGAGSPFPEIAPPSGGGVTAAIHVVRAAAPLREALRRLESRRPVALRYDRAEERLALVEGEAESTRKTEFGHLRSYRPPVRLAIFGRGVEAETVARLGAAAGYDVRLQDEGADPAPLDADSAVLTLHHDPDLAAPALKAALEAPGFYIGALGSRRTHEELTRRLVAAGHAQSEIDRIKAPIGVFGGARDSITLAFSILADVARARAQMLARD